jgi:hypothetical protein
MSRMTSLLAVPAVAAAVAAGLAGCSSGSASPATASSTAFPNAGLSGSQLLTAFKSAVASGTAVHVVGSIDQSGTPISLNLNLDKNGTSAGSVSQGAATVPLKVVNGVTYIQLTPTLLKQEAATDPAVTAGVISLIQNKWVSSQSSIGQSISSSFDPFTSYDTFLASIESGSASTSATDTASGSASSAPVTLGDLTAAGTASYNGGTVAVYKSSDGSTAYFAASGPAYLEKVTATGSTSGTITFTWNQPVTVTPPSASDIFSG